MKNIETERKFIIKKPQDEELLRADAFTESEILQIYLEDESATHRIRKRAYKCRDMGISYTENTKVRINSLSAYETENEITPERFSSLAENIEKGSRPLIKVRKTFDYSGKTFELDFYPEWERSCIMEIELSSECESIDFPPFIEIIKEVTGDKSYSNHAMAHRMPKELYL